MTKKQYNIIKSILVIALVFLGGRAVVWGNFVTPILGLAAISAVLLYLRGRVKEIMVDEMDIRISERAASMAIRTFSWITVIAAIVLYSLRGINPAFAIAGGALAYLVCFLLILMTGFYYYLRKYGKQN